MYEEFSNHSQAFVLTTRRHDSASQHKVAGAYVAAPMTAETCKELQDKWKACVAMCKKFKLEQKQRPKRSRGRASKVDHKSLRTRSPSPNPDSIQPPTFHSPNRARGMSLVPSKSASETSEEPLFAQIHFAEERTFPVPTYVLLRCEVFLSAST